MANRRLRWTFVAAALSAVVVIAPPALAGAGDLDPTFGDGGKVVADLQAPGSNSAYAAAVQPDGKIVVLGNKAGQAASNEFALLRYDRDGTLDPTFGDDGMALGLARIEAHFFINRLFLQENALLEGIGKVRHIPAVIVHGRYDVICPVATADALHEAWPEAEYKIIPEAGHSAMEPAIRAALIEATRKFAEG